MLAVFLGGGGMDGLFDELAVVGDNLVHGRVLGYQDSNSARPVVAVAGRVWLLWVQLAMGIPMAYHIICSYYSMYSMYYIYNRSIFYSAIFTHQPLISYSTTHNSQLDALRNNLQ